ncbi:MAG: hypothetical protein HY927_10415 [Elusimicrobia bacterium]|nr:hypothetical protein [Elusimicrobiota bacterium]
MTGQIPPTEGAPLAAGPILQGEGGAAAGGAGSRLGRAGLAVLACLAAVYVVACADLWLRARSAYLEGEKCLQWHADPRVKAAHFDRILSRNAEQLRREQEAGRLSAAELETKLKLLKFERDYAVNESSLKYAYVWFQTAVELFSPPESRWVKLSRVKMAETKELWKAELKAKKIPFQDYMLE